MPARHGLGYRPDIDGLRALAVVPVILFHAGVRGFGGGYTGVDIFFVISGYLIAATLMGDHRLGRFSILRFYERRARRIMPALLIVLLATFIASALIFAPPEAKSGGKSLIAAVAFASNIHFFMNGGYFSEASELRPLLHTWSLAVEEQFYLGFPLLLAVVMRWGAGAVRWTLIGLAAVSFGLSLWATDAAPLFNFYLPFTRAWELLAGAALAAGVTVTAQGRLREALALLGIVLLALPVILLTSETPFPGLAALPSVAGAALVIATAPGTIVGKLLAHRPLVYVGLISYPLYLWHWPILVFGRYANLGPLEGWQLVAALAAAVFLAAASFHLIELPVRHGERLGRRQIFGFAAAGSALMIVLGGLAAATNGMAFRSSSASAVSASAEAEAAAFANDPCLLRGAAIGDCSIGTGNATLALWGDSHAAHYAPLVEALAQDRGFSAKRFTKAGCAPILADDIQIGWRSMPDCLAFNQSVWEAIRTDTSIRTVIVAAAWSAYAAGSGRAYIEGGSRDRPESLAAIAGAYEAIQAEMRRRGGKLIVINQTPAAPTDSLVCYRAARFHGWDDRKCATYSAAGNRATQRAVDAAIMKRLREAGVEVIEVQSLFCTGGSCATVRTGKLLYLDDEHLSRAGAMLLKDRLARAMAVRR
jgi:peptidoglycan/LPS O-acetylase OafA/YrhL